MVKRVGNRTNTPHIGVRSDPALLEPTEQIQPTHEAGFVVREQLSTLITARRSPPSMNVVKTVAANESVSGEISPEGLELLGDIRGDVLAYHITELSMRLNQLDQADLSASHLRGIASVNQLTRMFEHLQIMRTSQV